MINSHCPALWPTLMQGSASELTNFELLDNSILSFVKIPAGIGEIGLCVALNIILRALKETHRCGLIDLLGLSFVNRA